MSDETESGRGSAYDAERDLEERIRLATPQYTTRGILFLATLATVRELGGEEMVRQCLEASGETTFVEFFNYPTRALLQMLAAAARLLKPTFGSYEAVLREIGRRTGAFYMSSVVGRSAQLVSAADPLRVMRTIEELYKVSMSYASPTVTWKGPKRGVLSVQCSFTPPPFHEGGAIAVASCLGLKNVEVGTRTTGPLSLEMEISWD